MRISVSGTFGPLCGAWPSGRVFVALDPGHQAVDARVMPAVDEAGDSLGEIALRVDGVQFAGFDQGSDRSPVGRVSDDVETAVAASPVWGT